MKSVKPTTTFAHFAISTAPRRGAIEGNSMNATIGSAHETEINTVSTLIEVLKDLEAGFRAAADEAVNPGLKTTLLHYAAQRHKFASELQVHAAREGEEPPSTGTLRQAARVKWMAAWSVVTPRTDLVILETCARCEDDAVIAYQDALEHGKLGDATEIGIRQNTEILAAQEQICALRDRHRAAEITTTSVPV